MEDKKKTFLTIVLSLVALIVLVIACVMVSKHYASQNNGHILVELIDLEGTTVLEKNIQFKKGDTLQYLLEDHFENVVIDTGMIMSIESFTNAPDWSTFISIYVNGEMSMVGLLDIEFVDGTTISFVMTEYIFS